MTPAEQILQVHDLLTAGLGIVPQSKDWPHVESVMALHDTNTNIEINIEKLRFQFGDSVALYFSFLSAYTQALLFPSILGLIFYLFDDAYSPIYSSLLLLWSISFTQWWSIRERILSVQWGTRGSFNVEQRRKDYIPGFPWWKRDLRIVTSIPVIIFFAAVLAGLLMVIFILEAFVTQLYTGPGHQFIVCLLLFVFYLNSPVCRDSAQRSSSPHSYPAFYQSTMHPQYFSPDGRTTLTNHLTKLLSLAKRSLFPLSSPTSG